MGTILAKDVVERAARQLNDLGAQRYWSQEELLAFLNLGQRAIALAKPEASSTTAAFQLAAGAKQGLPAGALRVIDITCNMGAAGSTRGRVIRFVEREALDQINPDWMAAVASGVMVHWTRDERDPDVWYCYPPQPSPAHYVEAIYATSPADCTINGVENGTTDSVISLDDIYDPLLYWFILGEALMKETTVQLPAKGQAYMNRFLTSLGLKSLSDIKISPAKNEEPAIGKAPRAGSDM